ncbi:MAG: bifunctional DNA-formamidopyrimidine glycosylase/DNA-(apurinic or apyrimidinic site) lyase [Proteobacteria bacterium]|nr:bifunctional DNA-formamidopyrimidine glycosylase/DNA-(apurinic or apyrimidinic site) lyase [Pseudomonadota bacterium]
MPELPEVETIRRGLAPHLEGRRIAHVTLNRPDLRLPFPTRLAERLEGARIGILGRRAKYLLVPLDTHETLVIHLGMSGRLLVLRPESAEAQGRFHHKIERLEQHDHMVIALDDGMRLIFNDPRRFGFVLLEPDATIETHPSLAGLGVEPLGNLFDAAYLLARFAGRRTPLKSALLDQSHIAGLGNIYVCEALHRAGLSPDRSAMLVKPREAERLVVAIRDVLNDALAAGGSSLKDYRHEDGSLGYFQHSFRVYDREGQPCPKTGCKSMVIRKTHAGRSTFFCPACQG